MMGKPLYNERYEPLCQIGEGSTSQVFMARDRKFFETKVVLKFLKSKKQIPDLNQDRLAEIERDRLDQLDHPHICRILDYFLDEENHLVLVLPYLRGQTLDKLWPPLSKTESVIVIGQILSALSYLHERNIRHGDLKASNIIIIRNQNQVLSYLIDFGLLGNMGSPRYAAPEQLNDMLGFEPDCSTDMYNFAKFLVLDFVPATPSIIRLVKKEILNKKKSPWLRLSAKNFLLRLEAHEKRISRLRSVLAFIFVLSLAFFLITFSKKNTIVLDSKTLSTLKNDTGLKSIPSQLKFATSEAAKNKLYNFYIKILKEEPVDDELRHRLIRAMAELRVRQYNINFNPTSSGFVCLLDDKSYHYPEFFVPDSDATLNLGDWINSTEYLSDYRLTELNLTIQIFNTTTQITRDVNIFIAPFVFYNQGKRNFLVFNKITLKNLFQYVVENKIFKSMPSVDLNNQLTGYIDFVDISELEIKLIEMNSLLSNPRVFGEQIWTRKSNCITKRSLSQFTALYRFYGVRILPHEFKILHETFPNDIGSGSLSELFLKYLPEKYSFGILNNRFVIKENLIQQRDSQ